MAIQDRPAAVVPPSVVPVRALLADRDDDTREMYAEYLRGASYDIDQAADGRQALAIAIARRPRIIVTETRLPGIDGFALCRLLRADDATRATPILIVTGNAHAPDLQRALDVGATEVLVKPCLPEVLLAKMNEILELSHALSDRVEATSPRAATHLRSTRLIGDGLRRTLVSSHQRRRTDAPPIAPPALACPQCGTALTYEHSQIGGVSARNSEQWDYFSSPTGCGSYQFRQRTRKLRQVG